jgi:predicted peptidase
MWSLLMAALVVTAPPTGPSAETLAQYEDRTVTYTGGDYDQEPFHYRIMKPEKIEPGKKYPLVFFLHGAGERGTDNEKQLLYLPEQMAQAEFRQKYPCFLVAPQCRPGKWWVELKHIRMAPPPGEASHQLEVAIQILQDVLQHEPIDRQRVYLTGLSMGGFGSWQLAARHPEWFAALAPICGGGDVQMASRYLDLPVWVAHGDADPVVPVKLSREMVDAIKAAGGDPKYSELPGVGHDSWTPAYHDPEGLLPWMFQQKNERISVATP